MKARVSESSAVLREMDSIHGRLRMIMEELAALDEKLHSNSPATVMTIRKVFSLDGTGLNESFMNELGNYNSIRKRANIDIHFDESTGDVMQTSFDRDSLTASASIEWYQEQKGRPSTDHRWWSVPPSKKPRLKEKK